MEKRSSFSERETKRKRRRDETMTKTTPNDASLLLNGGFVVFDLLKQQV